MGRKRSSELPFGCLILKLVKGEKNNSLVFGRSEVSQDQQSTCYLPIWQFDLFSNLQFHVHLFPLHLGPCLPCLWTENDSTRRHGWLAQSRTSQVEMEPGSFSSGGFAKHRDGKPPHERHCQGQNLCWASLKEAQCKRMPRVVSGEKTLNQTNPQ